MNPLPDAAFASALADRYRFVRALGAGGMATVHLAEDLRHGRQVAIKVLRDDLTASLGKERFLREISIAAGLTHPHILALHDSGEAAGRLFYVMPFVDGQSLRERLQRGGPLPVADTVRILRDIADAMEHAHRRNVVHRDLKPENVMLAERHALVTDFGVAKALSDSTGRQTLTTLGVALGTPTYMSPEQATADPQLDHRSDIYAFGVLAYEMLAGRPPFGGSTPQEVLAAHVTAAPTPVTAHRQTIPTPLATLVMRCLEKRAADRPQSASELLPVLEGLLTPSGGVTPHETAPVPAAWRSLAHRVSQRRPRTLAGLGAMAALVLSWLVLRGTGAGGLQPGTTGDTTWVAVLPPQVLGAPETGWFGDALAHELRGALASVPGAAVKGSWSSQSFKGSDKPIPQIARELGVRWVVASAVRWTEAGTGGRAVVTAELLEANADRVAWQDSFDTTIVDLAQGQAALASAVAQGIARALGLSGSTVRSASAADSRVTPQSYASFRAGRSAMERFTQEEAHRAVGHFRRAIAADSGNAQAHVWLSWAIDYWGSGSGNLRKDSTESAVAFERALALDTASPDVRFVRGWRRMRSLDWPGARSDFETAMASDEAGSWAAWGLVVVLSALGEHDRAIAVARAAAKIDPVTMGDLVMLALEPAGRMDEVRAEALAGLAVDSLSTSNQWYHKLAVVAALKGDVAASRRYTTRARELGLRYADMEVPALANAGRWTEAREALELLRVRTPPASTRELIMAYAALGDLDRAFALLDGVRDGREVQLIVNGAFYAPLRSDPRYAAFLRRVNLR